MFLYLLSNLKLIQGLFIFIIEVDFTIDIAIDIITKNDKVFRDMF